MPKILLAIMACLAVAGCTSGTYYSAGTPAQRSIVYGVDGNGNALRRAPGEVPPRASAAQACLRSYCPPEEDSK